MSSALHEEPYLESWRWMSRQIRCGLAPDEPRLIEGRVDFAVEQPLSDFIERWVKLPGIGDWTAHYIAMRVLKHPDAFPAADLILRREANPQGEPLTTKALLSLAENWRPWRAYSVMYLWRAATESAAARKGSS